VRQQEVAEEISHGMSSAKLEAITAFQGVYRVLMVFLEATRVIKLVVLGNQLSHNPYRLAVRIS
jgi:hypothetical protein